MWARQQIMICLDDFEYKVCRYCHHPDIPDFSVDFSVTDSVIDDS